MIDYETFARIKQLHEQQGLRCSQIAPNCNWTIGR